MDYFGRVNIPTYFRASEYCPLSLRDDRVVKQLKILLPDLNSVTYGAYLRNAARGQ